MQKLEWDEEQDTVPRPGAPLLRDTSRASRDGSRPPGVLAIAGIAMLGFDAFLNPSDNTGNMPIG
jgi:hypothetical protein